MRRVLMTALAAGAVVGIASIATPASASTTLTADGITYMLTLDSITNGGKTGNFTLSISGINTASDTEKGRTGINAFAFNDPSVGTAVSGISSGFTFFSEGLNSSGCHSDNSDFYCFANSGYAFPSPLGSGGSLSIDFSVTSDTAGSWDPSNWGTTDFKIDWLGCPNDNCKNNYDLVSKAIPLNTPPVPEPGTWALMMLGFAGVGVAMRRARKNKPALMQVA